MDEATFRHGSGPNEPGGVIRVDSTHYRKVPMERDRQRLDKVLWFTRTVKSRSLAVRLVESGYVRVNGQRATAPGKPIALGDVLTVALERDVRVLRIVAFTERRGPYKEACKLYEEWKEGA